MGYMDLDSYDGSDSAFDMVINVMDVMANSLKHELDTEKGNEYNTCGIVNVALFFEAFIIPNDEFNNTFNDSSLHALAEKTLKKLNKKIKNDNKLDWDNETNKNMHMNAYKRMSKSLKKFLSRLE